MVKVFIGSNHFALQQDVRALTDAFVGEHGDMAYERLDCSVVSVERITEAIQSVPFLAARKLVVLDAPSENKQFVERIEMILGEVSDTTDVYIIEPKVDKRTAYYKWLKKHTELKEYPELDAQPVSKWAVGYIKEQGSSMSSKDAMYLVERVGANQQLLSRELQKLALSGENVTRQTIDVLTEKTPESKIFDLLDAAFTGKTARALELYQEQRAMKVEPQEIIAMMGWQLRQVALAKTAGSKHDVVREGKMNPYSARKARAVADRITLQQLRTQIHDLVSIDVRSKRTSINLDDALQAYILQIS